MKIKILKNPLQLAIGARFRKLNDVLIFTLPIQRREIIDMLFVPEPLEIRMFDKEYNLVEKKILKPWQIYKPKKKFKYLVEYAVGKKVDMHRVRMKFERIKIIKPTKKVFDLVDYYKKQIKTILPKAKIELIGSLAVPMVGKEEMDILVIVDDIKKAQEKLKKIEFSIGPIFQGEGFSICRKTKIICEVHLVTKNHPKIKVYKKLIKKLQNNKKLVKDYEKFKLSMNGKTSKEYHDLKARFMKENNLIK